MRRTKHIDVRYHFVRDVRERGQVNFEFCPTKEMIADALTKSLPKPAFIKFRELLLGAKNKQAYEKICTVITDTKKGR